MRARILLKADEGWKDKDICKALDVGIVTVDGTTMNITIQARQIGG
jgi:hypothetical protein